MNAPVKEPESSALVAATPRQQFDLSPQTFEQALKFSEYLADSDLVPKDFKGRPGNCLIAMQWGMELGLKPLQAIQNIAPINGRPTLWGDSMLALVRASPLCEYVLEDWDEQGTARCRAKRRGEPEQVRTFSDHDAKLAGLLGKQGPWTTGPKRMKQLRARAFALRDVFTDVLRGMAMAEEVLDYPTAEPRNMGAADVVGATPTASSLPEFTQEHLDQRKAKIAEFYAKGKLADDIIDFYSLKSHLPDAMKQAIRDLAPKSTATDVAPKFTYAQVAERIGQASDLDALAIARDLISAVPDEAHRAELHKLADAHETELKE